MKSVEQSVVGLLRHLRSTFADLAAQGAPDRESMGRQFGDIKCAIGLVKETPDRILSPDAFAARCFGGE